MGRTSHHDTAPADERRDARSREGAREPLVLLLYPVEDDVPALGRQVVGVRRARRAEVLLAPHHRGAGVRGGGGRAGVGVVGGRAAAVVVRPRAGGGGRGHGGGVFADERFGKDQAL